jgi:hypothetical protein
MTKPVSAPGAGCSARSRPGLPRQGRRTRQCRATVAGDAPAGTWARAGSLFRGARPGSGRVHGPCPPSCGSRQGSRVCGRRAGCEPPLDIRTLRRPAAVRDLRAMDRPSTSRTAVGGGASDESTNRIPSAGECGNRTGVGSDASERRRRLSADGLSGSPAHGSGTAAGQFPGKLGAAGGEGGHTVPGRSTRARRIAQDGTRVGSIPTDRLNN